MRKPSTEEFIYQTVVVTLVSTILTCNIYIYVE